MNNYKQQLHQAQLGSNIFYSHRTPRSNAKQKWKILLKSKISSNVKSLWRNLTISVSVKETSYLGLVQPALKQFPVNPVK